MRPFRNLFRWLPLALSFAVYAPAQQPPPAPVVPPQTSEHHVSPAEAKELFRSVDDLLRFASEHTGLPIRHSVKKKLATREEVAKYVESRMREQGNGERFDHSALTLKKLGLLPRDFNLREYMLGLYKEQVEGWYDARHKTVYLLDWVAPEVQKPVMAHELVHALQDQNYDLEKWLNVRKDSKDETEQMVLDEQRTARQSIIEGQAMVVLFDYQLAPVGKTVEGAPDLVDSMKTSMLDEESTPMYAKAPIYLREAMLFPYTYGMDFVRAVLAKRGKQAAFAGVFEHPPLDTRQIMEPASYLAGEPPTQIKIVPLEKVLGAAWRRDDFSGLGEIDLRVILRQWAGKAIAAKLAPEWRGGYYMTLGNKKMPEDAPLSLALVLAFATPAAANDFATLYGSALSKRYRSVKPANFPHQWMTEEGMMRLYMDGSTVVALESFTPEDSAILHDALIPAATKL